MIPRRNIVRSIKKGIAQPGYAIQAIKQRGKSYLTYHFKDGHSSFPETISCLLTYRCNLRCKMCGQWGEKGSSKNIHPEILREELSVDVMKGIVNDVKGFKPNITLFGGEPLLHKDCLKIVLLIKQAGMRCNVITNGTLLEQYAKQFVNIGLDEIIFSLDGPQNIHDEMRNAKGTFDRAYKGLLSIAREKKKKGVEYPHVNISSTLFEINYRFLDDIVKVAEQLDATSITFHHLIFLNQKIYDVQNKLFEDNFETKCYDWEGFVRESLPEIDVKYLVDKINELRKRDSKVDISFYPNFTADEVSKYYTDFNFVPSSYKCRCISPWMVAYIFPDGSVRPCQSLNYTSGNIKEDTFRNIWNNDKQRHFREITKRNRVYPVCSRCTELYRF